ncbi:hypothetical protein [Halomonas sp. MS1]|nr:hypothetical protein [Halomonas sp. MS1]UTD55920.1 hypothetical protein NF683_01490 [Halomonas sp. MS1]
MASSLGDLLREQLSNDKQRAGAFNEQRLAIATAMAQGMLSHSTRYKPRNGASQNWHEALADEAFEIADALIDRAT